MLKRFFASFFLSLSLAIGALGLFVLPNVAYAQINPGLQQIGSVLNLSSADPRVIATQIINIALGLLGTIMVVLILYGGFLYMTSGGEAKKVESAKKVLTNSIIGAVIILSAWAIASFVLQQLFGATQDTGGGGGSGVPGCVGAACGGFGTSGGSVPFMPTSIAPQGSVRSHRLVVTIVFNRAVKAFDPTQPAPIVVMKNGGATVAGSFDVQGSVVKFTPDAACPAPNTDPSIKCFDPETDYVVTVSGAVESSAGQSVSCSSFGAMCEGKFHAGSEVDETSPTVRFNFPTDGMSVSDDSLQPLLASSTDEDGVAMVEFLDATSSIGVVGPTGTVTPQTFDAAFSWSTVGALLGGHTITVQATDVASNMAATSRFVIVRPAHCFDTQTNEGETGLNCGGDPSALGLNYCGACSGNVCSTNTDCSTGFCVSGTCVAQPVIRSMTPDNGRVGTFVTITGTNFGYTQGTVTFRGATGNEDVVAAAPRVCLEAGVTTWTNTQIIVAVPEGAVTGPVQVINGASGLAALTSSDGVPDFVVNDKTYPGLCALIPNGGFSGSTSTAIGEGFGSAGTVTFDNAGRPTSANVNAWGDNSVEFRVPLVDIGNQPVTLQTGGTSTNPVDFFVAEKALPASPTITNIDPPAGPPTQYVTIFGSGFGSHVGTVSFTSADGTTSTGSILFPLACGNSFWHDDRVIVKVPTVFNDATHSTIRKGTYRVQIKRADAAVSNSIDFSIDPAMTPTPGICSIEPSAGPVNTNVTIAGDGFGSVKPSVFFYNGQSALVKDGNTSQGLQTSVPGGAVTGPVSIDVASLSSNQVDFEVGNCQVTPGMCSAGETCCPTGECTTGVCGKSVTTSTYAWQTSTGLIPVAPYVIEDCSASMTPSPSPWLGRAGGDQVPVNATVYLRFSQILDTTSLTKDSFRFFKCTGTDPQPCSTEEPVTFSLPTPHVAESDSEDLVNLMPSAPFSTNTTYEVKVLKSVKAGGAGGTSMELMNSCGTGPGGETYGYCFRFHTRASSDPARVGSVNVAPSTLHMHDTGETAPYVAIPRADDHCIVLDCARYDWKWYTGVLSTLYTSSGAGLASITNTIAADGTTCHQIATGLSDTGIVPVPVHAAINTIGPDGSGDLYINFVPPKVVDYAPKCQLACSNAEVWADFSSALDESTVLTTGNVALYKCRNAECHEDEMVPLTLNSVTLGTPLVVSDTEAQRQANDEQRRITIDATPLIPGAYYRVVLKGGLTGITGVNGLPMDGTNDGQNYSWTFRANPNLGAALCTADRVDVVPQTKYETMVNASQVFSATPFSKPDACSANGQALIQKDASKWKSADPSVAYIYTLPGGHGGKLVNTGNPLSPNCSGSCLATGSNGQFGKVAVCGDKVIETTDPTWCNALKNSAILDGIAWSDANCLTMAAGSKAGEECEPSLPGSLGANCDPNTCLFRPVSTVDSGGSCGDGSTDFALGEACDYGVRCSGGSSATTTPSVPEGAPCGDPTSKAVCLAAGGSCGVMPYHGCDAHCRHTGSVLACGNGDAAGDGKDCEDGNHTSGDGCSAICLHEGSQPSSKLVAVCGNGTLEPGEACECLGSGSACKFSAGCNPKTCLHTGTPTAGTAACASPVGIGCCGNGHIESGEDCDDGNTQNGDGCSASCLFEGASAYYTNANGTPNPSFCGDGVLEYGEQCEAGSGLSPNPGLSSDVVAKAIDYTKKSPSVADALKLAPYSGPTGKPNDTQQLAVIVGDKTPDASGYSTTTLSATVEGKAGTATYGLQCGFTDETSCVAIDPNLGLDTNGCCAPRPQIDEPRVPTPDAGLAGDPGVCRNVLIEAKFDDFMDSSSVVNDFELSQSVVGSVCGSGMQPVAFDEPTYAKGFMGWVHHTWDRLVAAVTGHPVYADVWCKGAVTGQLKPVGSTTSSKMFSYTLDHALAPNTIYRVRFLGDASTSLGDGLADNKDLSKRIGVKTTRGVVQASNVDVNPGNLIWSFKTSDKICTADVVTISDITDTSTTIPVLSPHPFVFENVGGPETRYFTAEVRSVQPDKTAVPLSTSAEYAWDWMPWTSGNTDLVTVAPAVSPAGSGLSDSAASASSSATNNGSTVLAAGIEINVDTLNVPTTSSTTVKGIAAVNVMACHNPWPSIADGGAPFRDMDGSLNLADTIFDSSKDPSLHFFNFSTSYCRDASVRGTSSTADLPEMLIQPIKPSKTESAKGILREYLFTYPAESTLGSFAGQGLNQDGIGIRIISNSLHLSPESWYQSQGFKGSPTSLVVDGYPAIKDGTTLYVAAANREKGSIGPIYSNIYLISYNANAQPLTIDIYNQMVKSLTFNINKEFVDQTNVCTDLTSGKVYEDPEHGNLPVACKADWECMNFSSGAHAYRCDSTKWKLVRDTLRMTDFQYLSSVLEANKSTQGKYPLLTGGTFLQNQTNSLWSSWDKELGSALGVTSMPLDPINKFLTCGKCGKTAADSSNGDSCEATSDCSAGQSCFGGRFSGAVWNPDASIDPATCWQEAKPATATSLATTADFACPAIPHTGAYGVSHIYQYQTYSGGTQYSLASDFEVQPSTSGSGGAPTDWWTPPLPQTFYSCTSKDLSIDGRACTDSITGAPSDSLCRPCPNGICTKCQAGAKAGQFCVTADDCGTSGDTCAEDAKPIIPVVGSCRQVGATFKYSHTCRNVPVNEAGHCGDGIIQISPTYSEVCDAGMNLLVACQVSPGVPGHRLQVCDMTSCQKYVDDPAHPQCVADALCGNGRVDSTCVGGPKDGLGCLITSDCADASGGPGGACTKSEVCDEGSALNGKYGHCNNKCTGYGAYCGDGVVSPGETCDFGALNGTYCGSTGGTCTDPALSCSTTCQSTAGYCGDKIENGPEQCDGTSDQTQSKICSTGPDAGQKVCTGDTDCAKDPVTGAASICGGGSKVCVLGKTPGVACSLDSDCAGGYCASPLQSCVGVKYTDPTSGSVYETQHTRTCTLPGDPTNQCKWPAWSACQPKSSCGDGIVDDGTNGTLNAGEQCDDGSKNSDTGACTLACKKNVCGDDHVNVGVEECDNGTDNGSVTCSASYGSSCLSCSKVCKWQASAGGYCGDGAKNGPEQCDPSDPKGPKLSSGADVTCQSLGYDFASTGWKLNCGTAPVAICSAGTKKGQACLVNTDCGAGGVCGTVCTTGIHLGTACTTDADCHQYLKDGSVGVYNRCGEDQRICVSGSEIGSRCSLDSDCLGGGKCQLSQACSIVPGNGDPTFSASSDKAVCSNSCSYSGCERCSDPLGSSAGDFDLQGSVTGTIMDPVYATSVPMARVTLLYNGIKVGQTYSQHDGTFVFSNILNRHPSCGQYKIVVDEYEDNPLTPAVNEAVAGGYWSYTSKSFAVNSFNSVGIENPSGLIYLMPRVPKYQTLVMVTWNGAYGAHAIESHLVVPKGMSFTPTLTSSDGRPYTACSGTDCIQDLHPRFPGDPNLDAAPNASFACQPDWADSTKTDCGNFNSPPDVLKYSWKLGSGGAYQFYMVDKTNAWQFAAKNFCNPLHMKAFVVTSGQVQENDASGCGCDAATGVCSDKAWWVFSQDSFSGDVNVTPTSTPWLSSIQAAAVDGLMDIGP